MTPEECERFVPPVLLRPEDVAEAVRKFVEDETMAGRVMIWQKGEPWQIVPLFIRRHEMLWSASLAKSARIVIHAAIPDRCTRNAAHEFYEKGRSTPFGE